MELENELPSTLSQSTILKDVRAYEHSRQLARRAAERMANRARKDKGWSMCRGAIYDKTKCSCCQSNKVKRLRPRDAKGLLDGEDLAGLGDTEENPQGELGPIQGAHPSQEVRLADLVMPTKPRKGKGSSFPISGASDRHLHFITEGDYEFIPHVRSVIVLDDGFSSDEHEQDEAWEHVHGEEKTVGPSYAEVVAIAK
jgi:hypothetical protein